jgi:hypothetical protein
MGQAHSFSHQASPRTNASTRPPVSLVIDRRPPPPLACLAGRRAPPSFVSCRTGPPSSSTTPWARPCCFLFTPYRRNRAARVPHFTLTSPQENPPSKDPTTSLSAPYRPFVHPHGWTRTDIAGIKATTIVFPLLLVSPSL